MQESYKAPKYFLLSYTHTKHCKAHALIIRQILVTNFSSPAAFTIALAVIISHADCCLLLQLGLAQIRSLY